MGLEQFLSKTDLLLYKKILHTIIQKWDTIDPETLSDFLEKLGELHGNLNNVVKQMKTYSMYHPVSDTPIESKKVKSNSVSLTDILHTIKKQRRKHN
jgi:hypothetical protein